MDGLLFFREKVKSFYVRNDIYLLPVIKFLLMMGVLLTMNWHLGYRYVMMRWILVILVSLVTCLLPWSAMTAISALYLLGHVSEFSWEAAAVLLILMLAAVIVHFFFVPGGSILIVLIPLAFYFKVPYLMPLLAGVYGSALSFLPVGIGVVMYYFLMGLEQNAVVFLNPGTAVMDRFMQAVSILQHNKEMFLYAGVFMVVTLFVFAVHHISLDYARLIGIAGGGLMIILGLLLGSMFLGISTADASMFIICAICTFLAILIAQWSVSLDYNHVERFQYEDDEYIYYVKAIPKIEIAEGRRRIHEIDDDSDD